MGSGLAYVLVFTIIYLLDGAKRWHSMVLIEIMIVIVFFFLGDIRILIPIETFPSNLFWPLLGCNFTGVSSIA